MKDPKGGPYEFIEFEKGFRITAENYDHTCFKKDDASHDDMILRWNALNAAWRYGRASLEVKREPLRMNAYYYSFSSTGCYEVDRILSAVACAGKAFHNTDCWTDECDPYDGHVGGNPIDWIQNAANDCATAFKTIYEAGRKAERERCAKIVETENVKFYANGFISQKWIICRDIAEKIRGGQDGK